MVAVAGLDRRLQLAQLIDVHARAPAKNTLRQGYIFTDANRPALVNGSAATKASTSARSSESNTIRLPTGVAAVVGQYRAASQELGGEAVEMLQMDRAVVGPNLAGSRLVQGHDGEGHDGCLPKLLRMGNSRRPATQRYVRM